MARFHLTTPVLNRTVQNLHLAIKNEFGLLRFRSPLLTKYLIRFSSTGYWNVLLPQVNFSTSSVKILTKSEWVSPFGHLRIIGYEAPSRSVSPPRRVLHRLSEPRHPPYALKFPIRKSKNHNCCLYNYLFYLFLTLTLFCFQSVCIFWTRFWR